VRWSVDVLKEYAGWMPAWGYAASPVLFGDAVIVLPGGYAESKKNASFLALDRKTGKKIWAKLTDPSTYSTPILYQRGKRTQLVCWNPSHIRGLDAATGELLWAVPFEIGDGWSLTSPICFGDTIFVSGFGSPLRVDETGRTVTPAWQEKRDFNDLISQPLCRAGYVYLLDQRYGLTCVELATGKKLWDDKHRVTPREKYPQVTMVWIDDADRALILNAEGELILARLNPAGYTELARAKVVGPTWAHPAYAGHYVYARDDHEIVCRELPLAD
jgi:outer membrane protein assembly factor BamB